MHDGTSTTSAANPYRGYGQTSNLVGVATEALANVLFNDHPVPLSIAGARALNPALFMMLAESEGPADAALAFETYMAAAFGLDPEQRRGVEAGKRRFRSSYFRLLRGWGTDSNGREGAVLKGWVESRFGLYPTYHGGELGTYPSPAWIAYIEQKMASRFHNNAILSQLDLLYEFCQWVLDRHGLPDQTPADGRTVRLFRGVNGFEDHPIVARHDRRVVVVRLNSLVSFTRDRGTADTFGDTILEARVPFEKIVFFDTLLPRHGLTGESEVLVLGGEMRVRATTF